MLFSTFRYLFCYTYSRMSELSQLEAPQQADAAQAEATTDKARYAYLFTAVVHYNDLTFDWKDGTMQRTLEPSHVNRLKEAYLKENGPDRKSTYRYLRVGVRKADVEEYWTWKLRKEIPWETFLTYCRNGKPTLAGWTAALNGKRIEVEAGQHRMHALIAYLKEKNPDITDEELNNDAWWYADVYDLGTYIYLSFLTRFMVAYIS